MAKLTLTFKGNLLRVIPVKDGIMTIGRDPSCEIHIDSLAVHPLHAQLETRNGKTRVSDSGSPDGTFVNHLRIDEKELADNDIIRIGKHVLKYLDVNEEAVTETVSAPPPPPVVPADPVVDNREGWLQILSGKELGKSLRLKSGLTELGRHGLPPALVTHRDGTYFIASLGEDAISVGDDPIGEKSRPLRDGDLIRIGNIQVQFYLQ